MQACTVIFPHQLFDPHPALSRGRPVVLVEDSLFFGDRIWPARFHVQKLMLHRASMLAYAASLRERGYEVEHLRAAPGLILQEQLGPVLQRRQIETIHLCEPEDDVLRRRLRRLADAHGLRLEISASPMFLATVEASPSAQSPSGSYLMAQFYSRQRRRHRILLDPDGKPRGGTWSFDAENRRKWPAGRREPDRWRPTPSPFVDEARREIEREFPRNIGTADGFDWPVTRAEAERQLDDFIAHRLREFGPYEDALSCAERVMHHSLLTPALNTGLLTPDYVLRRVLEAGEEMQVPLNSLEGFVRQVLGWREFMRIVYAREGARMRTRNFWEHTRPMPAAFYTATTGLPPADLVIRRTLDHAWSHHIERLMVLGNLMLLCRIHPDEVYRWFMELFIDAYDWVMVPNVYGMSQFADGGLITTKPYISGSNYLRKMSDFDSGPWTETWDGLFWTFIEDHRDFFLAQPRLGMMARQLERMDATRRRQHRRRAEDFLGSL